MWFVCLRTAFPSSTQYMKGQPPKFVAPDVAAALNPAWSPTPDLYPALTALAHLSTPLYSAYYTDMYMSIWRQTMRTHTRTLPH